MDEEKLKIVTLTLTQDCNLACSYCYEHHKSKRKMDIATAKHIIDVEFENCDAFDSIEIDLFGGEPFLAFDEMKEITDYICQKKKSIPCTIFATTNGTLVHGEIQEWLCEHTGCFVCGLSLDGTRAMHNLNRSNSYDDIDLEFFLKHYQKQDIKMTISQETLPFLSEGVIDLHNKGFFVSCNLAYEIDWSAEKNTTILQRELEKLITYYLEHPDIEPCSMLEMGFSNVGTHESQAVRYCGAGYSMKAYDVTGEAYPCQFFMPLSVGDDKAAAAQKMVFPEDVIPESCLDEKCKDCVIRSVCPNCFGSNYASTGSIYQRDDNLCRLTKIILKARSYFRALEWERGQSNMSAEDEQTMLLAITRIQEKLVI